MNNHLKLFSVIFLCSFSSIAYEICLIRIFSVSLWYHFAFMIISIAMLGIGASGTFLSLNPRPKNLSRISTYAVLLGTGIGMSYIITNQIPFDPVKLSWSKMQLFYIGLYYLTVSLPFFFAGLVIATAFSAMSEKSGLLYGSDLLGAGAGSLGILFLLSFAAPDRTVFIVSSAAFIAAFIAGGRKLKTISVLMLSLTVILVFVHPAFIHLRMSPYKGLQAAMQYPGAEHIKTYFSPYSRIDIFRSPTVRFAPGISLKYLDTLPEQIGLSIDGGEMNAITRSGDKPSIEFVRYLPSSLPYELNKLRPDKDTSRDVLILEPRGGLQVLVARYYGLRNIYKIESNPLLIEVVGDDFKEFSGGIYNGNTRAGLGRSWLKFNDTQFDVIDIQMMGTSPSGSFGISEDYRFTIEAFKEYLLHLKSGGVLSTGMYIIPPPRIELRVLNTIISAANELGMKNIENHIAAIRSWGTICILIKRTPFTVYEIETIRSFSEEKRFDIIHYPGVREEETNRYVQMPSNDYFRAFRDIMDPDTRKDFTLDYLFDINPVRDENPFFNYYLKIGNLREIYETMGEKWIYFIEEGYILPVIFAQVLLLSLILMILPAVRHSRVKVKVETENPDLSLLPYFAFIGTGFMFVEVALIQKMILPLENPSYAFAAVLTSILISSGAGSLFSHILPALRHAFTLMIISFLVIVYSFLLPYVSDWIAPLSLPYKLLSVSLTLLPLGFFMGIPFPSGMRTLSEKDKSLIPWAWAINGCFSVLAPLLTVMLAIVAGFKAALWVGSLMYAMAFLTLRLFIGRLNH
jgi:hypothetical protein